MKKVYFHLKRYAIKVYVPISKTPHVNAMYKHSTHIYFHSFWQQSE